MAWAEAIPQIATHEVSDAVYAGIRTHFDVKALVDLKLVINAINGWIRMNVGLRIEAGNYVSPHAAKG